MVKEIVKKYEEKLNTLLGLTDIEFIIKNKPVTDDLWYYVKGDNPEPATIYVKTSSAFGKDIIASFSLRQLDGCCGACVSYHSLIYHKYRNKRVGTILNEFRKEIATELGYSLLLCTDIVENVYQAKILEKNGWIHVHQFTNQRTNNLLNLSVINL